MKAKVSRRLVFETGARLLAGAALGWVMVACAANESLSKPLLDAVLAGNAKEAERLISAGASPNLDPAGNCLLFAPVTVNRPDMIELLVKRGAQTECRAKKRDDTPLHRALEQQHLEAAGRLVALGADVNASPGRSGMGYTPLQVAVFDYVRRKPQTGLSLIDQMLRHGGKPNLRSTSGFTALGFAVGEGDRELIELLLRGGADPNLPDGQGQAGMTPLEVAVSNGRGADIIRLLLEAGADPKKEAVPGRTLDVARRLRPEAVPLLLQYGARDALEK